jgi:hypothetical protein
VTCSIASARATPTAIAISPASLAGGRSSTEASNEAPDGAIHTRPWRPRPLL